MDWYIYVLKMITEKWIDRRDFNKLTDWYCIKCKRYVPMDEVGYIKLYEQNNLDGKFLYQQILPRHKASCKGYLIIKDKR